MSSWIILAMLKLKQKPEGKRLIEKIETSFKEKDHKLELAYSYTSKFESIGVTPKTTTAYISSTSSEISSKNSGCSSIILIPITISDEKQFKTESGRHFKNSETVELHLMNFISVQFLLGPVRLKLS